MRNIWIIKDTLDELTPAEELEICKEFWPLPNSQYPYDTPCYERQVCAAFFIHLREEIFCIRKNGDRFAVRTLQSVIKLVQLLKISKEKPLSTVIQDVSKEFLYADKDSIYHSL
jgi:hypothetical protein